MSYRIHNTTWCTGHVLPYTIHHVVYRAEPYTVLTWCTGLSLILYSRGVPYTGLCASRGVPYTGLCASRGVPGFPLHVVYRAPLYTWCTDSVHQGLPLRTPRTPTPYTRASHTVQTRGYGWPDVLYYFLHGWIITTLFNNLQDRLRVPPKSALITSNAITHAGTVNKLCRVGDALRLWTVVDYCQL